MTGHRSISPGAGAVALAVAACAVLGTSACSTSGFDFQAGQCISGITRFVDADRLKAVECTTEHDAEVVSVVTMPDDAKPSGIFVDDRTKSLCEPGYQDFVGVEVDRSVLELRTLAPDSESWDAGDRKLVCMVVGKDGKPVSTSYRGAAR